MIPKNITRASIVKAIDRINFEGIPVGRDSTKYNVKYNDMLYPPKYVLSLSNLYENGVELKSDEFGGGKETNNYLVDLGFDIISKIDISCFTQNKKELDLNKECLVSIATVTIQSPLNEGTSYEDSVMLLENIIRQAGRYADVMILPAGYFYVDEEAKTIYDDIKNHIIRILIKENLNTTVCLGIDGLDSIDQVGIAINKQGIISVARKFYPTDGEKGRINLANNFISNEQNYNRIFDVKGKKFYLAICYDGFGISHQRLSNPGIDGILNMVHRFYPRGYPSSGEVYFAKYSFAASSKQWNCPTFGTAIFYGREVPEKWPTAVMWNQGLKNVKDWKYTDNDISVINRMEVSYKDEKAVIKVYEI